jgi:hypothetical protein
VDRPDVSKTKPSDLSPLSRTTPWQTSVSYQLEQLDQRHEQLTTFADSLVDMFGRNTDYFDYPDRHTARLDSLDADTQKLQSDTVRHGQFEKELRRVQSQMLELSFRLARTLDDLPNDDDNSDYPPRRTGRTPIRGRSDREQNHD